MPELPAIPVSSRNVSVICPSELLDDFHLAKRLDDLGSSVLEQMALTTFIQSGLYERQLRRSVREVVLRRHALVEALRRRFRDQVEIGGCALNLAPPYLK